VTPMTSPHVSEYMTSGPFAVGPREPLGNARRLMDKYDLRHLPVWSEGKLVGIVSDRDLNFVQTLEHAPPDRITVGDAMTPDPYAPTPDTPLADVVRVMVDRKIGSAVVVDGGQIVGILTATDAMRALLDALGGKLAPLSHMVASPSSRRSPQGRRGEGRRKYAVGR
jgi:acetoin utilization protein AcuB